MRRARRGMTLLELVVAVSILIVVITITMQVIVSGVNMARNSNETGEGNETARLAGDTIALQARMSGMGSAGGLTVLANGAVRVVSPILAVNSATGPDELWVVSPGRSTFGAGCDGNGAHTPDQGAAAIVMESRVDGILKVRCANTLTSLIPGTFMVTNLTTSALISVFGTAASGTQISFNEAPQVMSLGFTNNPKRNGFTAGDMVVPVNILRYYVAPNGPNNELTLMVAQGRVNPGAGFPFVVVPNTERALVSPVEDLQVQFGVDPSDGDDPSSVVWRNGTPCAGSCYSDAQGSYVPGTRSLVVSVVSRSRRLLKNNAGTGNIAGLIPLSVFDHIVPAVPDGLRRVKYERRIELPNAQPWNL